MQGTVQDVGGLAETEQTVMETESVQNSQVPVRKRRKALKIVASVFMAIAVAVTGTGIYLANSKVDVEMGAAEGGLTIISEDTVNDTVRLALKLESSESGNASLFAPGRDTAAINVVERKATYAIMVNGIEVVACLTEDDARWALNQLLDDYKTDDMVTYNFVETVRVQTSEKLAVSKEEALIALKQCAPYDSHVVMEDETLQTILKKYSMTEAEFEELNGSTDIKVGQLLKVKGEGSYLNFTYTVTTTKDTTIPYTTQTVNDATLNVGTTKVKQAGKNGVARTTYTTTYINGVAVETTQGETVTVSAPVTKIIRKGTKVPGNKVDGAPQLIWPLPGTIRITSYYGNRNGEKHTGLDMGAAAGTNIYAAASGRVTMVQRWDGVTKTGNQSYGNMVKIDHGNGFETLYAHMLTTPKVTVGQYVTQGTVIGLVGNTGNSFGNHLHFEFRINGVTVDPLIYLP